MYPYLEPIEVQPISRKRMKLLIPLSLLLFLPTPGLAGSSSQRGYSQEQTCYETVYREEYIPGTRRRPGRIETRNERVEVPCENSGPQYAPQPQANQDDNSCLEGSILGGIAGAAGGAALSRDEGMFIGIPLGIVGGALIGCQLDGG